MKALKNKKGITLVEVIVVLVIMAILAGITVGAYTGYIDEAKDKAILVEARAAYLAVATIYNEKYATEKDFNWTSQKATIASEAATLAGVAGTISLEAATDPATMAGMTYSNNGNKCTLGENNVWTVTKS